MQSRFPTVARFLLLVLFPLTAGGLFYVLFRPLSLRFFTWMQDTRLEETVIHWRQAVQPLSLPGWMIYNLPCGLWLFAFVNALLLLRADKRWIFLAVALPLASEIAQLAGLASGTFDLLDLLAYLSGAAASLFLQQDRSPKPLAA